MEESQSTVGDFTIASLQSVFQFFDQNGDGQVSADDLEQLINDSLKKGLNRKKVLELFREVSADSSNYDEGTFNFLEFTTYVLSKRIDAADQLQEAFVLLDRNADGKVNSDDLRVAMAGLVWTSAIKDIDKVFLELDLNGDGALDLAEFSKPIVDFYLLRKRSEIDASATLFDLTMPPSRIFVSEDDTEEMPTAQSQTMPENELERMRGLLARHSTATPEHGSSVLQMQIGLFRLIQGAAYRCFRTSFSANHETHLPVRDLPYRMMDLVPFVRSAIQLYKELRIVSADCHQVLDAVTSSLEAEYARLLARVKGWDNVDKTAAMLAEAQQMTNSASSAEANRLWFVMFVEQILSQRKPTLEFIDIVNEVFSAQEMQSLNLSEISESSPGVTPAHSESPRDYLARWNRVILVHANESVPGAMVPVAYWYEDFMPKLLAAFSVTSASEIAENTSPDEVALMKWYEEAAAAGEFMRHGPYIPLVFPQAIPAEKLRIKQAWRLARHYLNGVQKRRERFEFGRDSGALSQYVAFIDVYLGRTFIRDADMRLSFPYYIGPAVWRFLHTTGEIAASRLAEEQKALVARFKEFFRLFASLYPCPYCRHHLNAYVVENREVDMYPIEYTLLGHKLSSTKFENSLEDKLATITDGRSLGLFLWKLHNTVSSSISRSEDWYKKDEGAFYTTRFWPSIDAELARARARGQISINTDRVSALYDLWKPLSRLSYIRDKIQLYFTVRDEVRLQEAISAAHEHVAALEMYVLKGEFLQEIYRFDPERGDQDPSFTPEEEAYSRSSMFVSI